MAEVNKAEQQIRAVVYDRNVSDADLLEMLSGGPDNSVPLVNVYYDLQKEIDEIIPKINGDPSLREKWAFLRQRHAYVNKAFRNIEHVQIEEFEARAEEMQRAEEKRQAISKRLTQRLADKAGAAK